MQGKGWPELTIACNGSCECTESNHDLLTLFIKVLCMTQLLLAACYGVYIEKRILALVAPNQPGTPLCWHTFHAAGVPYSVDPVGWLLAFGRVPQQRTAQ